MKIMAPVSSIEAARLYATLGIEEVYVGVESLGHHDMKNVAFTGRSNLMPNGGRAQLKTFDDLGEVVRICHDNGMRVNFTANVRNLPDPLTDRYVEWVECALAKGVDGLIVGSIAALVIVTERKYNVPVSSGTFFYPFNRYNVDFFHGFGVKRIILPTALSFEEIGAMTSHIRERGYDMEVEVFCQFGCSNINGRCNIFYEPPSICRGKFRVVNTHSGDTTNDCSFLDAAKDCSLCALHELDRLGVHSIKIQGRGFPLQLVGAIARLYRHGLDGLARGAGPAEIRSVVLKTAPWWDDYFCKGSRCLYQPSETSRYYI